MLSAGVVRRGIDDAIEASLSVVEEMLSGGAIDAPGVHDYGDFGGAPGLIEEGEGAFAR